MSYPNVEDSAAKDYVKRDSRIAVHSEGRLTVNNSQTRAVSPEYCSVRSF